MTTINPEKAAQVVALIEDGRSRRYVAEALDLSVSTVQRAYARYLDTNSFQRRSGSGRPRCTTDNDDRFIVLNSLRDRHRTAVQIRNNLRDIRNMNISVDTVRRRLAEQNLFSRKPVAVPLLTRRHRVVLPTHEINIFPLLKQPCPKLCRLILAYLKSCNLHI